MQAELQGLDAGPLALGQPLAAAAAMDTLVESGALVLAEQYTTAISQASVVAATGPGAEARRAAAAVIQPAARPSLVTAPSSARPIGAIPAPELFSVDNTLALWIAGAVLVGLLLYAARRKR